MEDKIFYPESFGISRCKIAEIISDELTARGHGEASSLVIFPKLTDELCQEIVNDWFEEPNPGPPGELWDDNDPDMVTRTHSDKWVDLFIRPQK